jgi:hydroxypyruvate reductase
MVSRHRPSQKSKSQRRASLRRAAKKIFRAAVDSVRADRVIPDFLALEKTSKGERLRCGLRRFPLRPGGRLIVVGAGKASAQMARAAESRLGRQISGGVVVTQTGHAVPCRRIDILEAGHPVPDAAGLEAGRRIGEWVDGAGEDDLVLFLLSGGGSALLPAPAGNISLEDKRTVTGSLLKAGAPIEALNCVRKHLSSLKGGHLARRAAPARVVTLVISDVVGDRLDVIASGPACGDPTTFDEARDFMRRYGVWADAPRSVRRHIERGIGGKIPETPGPSDPVFARVHHQITASNETALKAAGKAAQSLGFRPFILTRRLQGEAREIGVFLAGLAAGIRSEGRPIRPPACLLLGGETTVTVRGSGLGGRCQELATSFSANLKDIGEVCLLAAGTDGKDGPTPAAGGIVDAKTAELLQKQSIDPGPFLRENRSYDFVGRFGELIATGPTGTNVMDIIVMLVPEG